MAKTVSERILAVASKKNFTRKVAEQTFKAMAENMSSTRFDSVIMSTARKLVKGGKLQRVSRGVYRAK